MNTINWSRKAVKQLRKINRADQPKIYDAAQALADMPNVQNIKTLVNHLMATGFGSETTASFSTGTVG